MTPKALKSVSLSASSKKRTYRISRKLVSFIYNNLNFVYTGWFVFYIYLLFSYRDQLHKLVFDNGGLPDGTELGYYARGQVTYLILCVFISLFTWPSLLRHNTVAEIGWRLQNGCWNILLLLQE